MSTSQTVDVYKVYFMGEPAQWPGRRTMPQRGLTLRQIVSTAIALADEGGLDAVTMRAVGQRLGVSGMAVYRHVANRDQLIEQMVEAVAAEFAYPQPRPIGWRAGLAAVARQDWRSYFAHPWVLPATASARPPMGPNTLASMEWALASFDNLGLPSHDQLYLLGVVISYGQGLALTWLPELAGADREPGTTTEWWHEQVGGSGHPRLQAVTEAVMAGGGRVDIHEEFEFGLQRVLDGIETYVTRRKFAP
jgi:AcrR family transcriptional regulator